MCVGYMSFCVCSRLPSATSTITRRHILQANLMFALKQTAVVDFSRTSGSSSSRKRTWHHFFTHMPLSTIAVNSGAKSWNIFGSRRHLSLATVFYFRPETLSMYRREFPEHADKSIFACWCWLCSSNRQVAVCTFRSKALSCDLVSRNDWNLFCQISWNILVVTWTANVTFGLPRRYSFICAK